MGRSGQEFQSWERADQGAREIHGERITGRVNLDNATFEQCSFHGAVLVYSGGVPPIIRECSFQDVSFEFADAAGRTLALLQAMSAGSSGLRGLFKASFPKLFGN